MLAFAALGGCATQHPSYDYTAFNAHFPRSILILPPLNESTSVTATYGYLSTVTRPVAERGYYVFPVAVVDQFLKHNGMPTPGEMHQVPLAKVRDVIGADAVLFATINEYGSKYKVLSSDTVVRVSARLVDTRTGTLLWEGHGTGRQSSGSSGNIVADLVGAVVAQGINSSRDTSHDVSRVANAQLFTLESQGLPYGPYSPLFGKSP